MFMESSIRSSEKSFSTEKMTKITQPKPISDLQQSLAKIKLKQKRDTSQKNSRFLSSGKKTVSKKPNQSFGKLEWILQQPKEHQLLVEEKVTREGCIDALKQVVISQRERIEELEQNESDNIKKQKQANQYINNLKSEVKNLNGENRSLKNQIMKVESNYQISYRDSGVFETKIKDLEE